VIFKNIYNAVQLKIFRFLSLFFAERTNTFKREEPPNQYVASVEENSLQVRPWFFDQLPCEIVSFTTWKNLWILSA